MTDDELAGIACARCNRPAPITLDELAGTAGGDPALLPILIPPPGWFDDPDGDGIICLGCSTITLDKPVGEHDAHLDSLADTDRRISEAHNNDDPRPHRTRLTPPHRTRPERTLQNVTHTKSSPSSPLIVVAHCSLQRPAVS